MIIKHDVCDTRDKYAALNTRQTITWRFRLLPLIFQHLLLPTRAPYFNNFRHAEYLSISH